MVISGAPAPDQTRRANLDDAGARHGVAYRAHGGTGSAVVYFAQPLLTAAVVSMVLVGSAIAGRPFTQRFAHDFCPIDPELLDRPRVRRFFVRISLLWATMLLLNAGIVLWLLLSSSLRTFVLERTAVTWGLTAAAVFVSISRFVAAMRSDGITVEWGQSRPSGAVTVNPD